MEAAYEGPIHTITRVVAEQHGITLSEIRSARRSRDVTGPRQIAMALSAELVQDTSLPQIGRAFNRDHTTVIHAIRVVSERIERDDAYNQKVQEARAICTSLLSTNPRLRQDSEQMLLIAHARGLALAMGDAYTKRLLAIARDDPQAFVNWVTNPPDVIL